MDNVEFHLAPDQRKHVEEIATKNQDIHINRRARLLLSYDAGNTTKDVADEVGLCRGRARYWRRQFILHGMDIFPAQEQQAPSIINTLEEDIDAVPRQEHITVPSAEPVLPQKPITYPRPFSKIGIEPDDSMAEAGRKALLFHFAEMLSHEEGTRAGEDIEELHDMRVATRRMRAAFRIFGVYFTDKSIKPHLKDLRTSGRVLGRVRDLDVFIDKAYRYLETLPEENRSGLDPLVGTWLAERESARARMLTYLESEAYDSFKRKFYKFLTSPGEGVKSVEGDNPLPNLVKDTAPVLIYTRWASVRAYDSILSNASLEQLHALRIEFKQLRYAVEFFREVLGDQTKSIIQELKTVQDHLGDLNDARVACQLLTDFLAEWETRLADLSLANRQSPEAIVAFLAYKHAERHQLMVTFPQTWEKFIRHDFHKNLALAVSVL